MIPVEYAWNNATTSIYSAIDINKLNELFWDYINYGG